VIDVIYNEDCLDGMKRIPDGSVDMILCDLPYGTTRNKWDSIIPLEPLWGQYKRILKSNGAAVLTAQLPFSVALAVSNLAWLKYEWIWEKDKGTGFLNASRAPLKSHENVLVFGSGALTYNAQKAAGTPYARPPGPLTTNYNKYALGPTISDGSRYPKTVLRYARERGLHPTQKPVALFEYLIRTYTNEGETVLDNCMGSGTTAIACLNTGRHYIGFEKDPHYFDVCQNRIEAQKQSAAVASSVPAQNYGLFSQAWSASGAE
jgi:site-specific DNA-methyltransferase (adenine-specific)